MNPWYCNCGMVWFIFHGPCPLCGVVEYKARTTNDPDVLHDLTAKSAQQIVFGCEE